MLYNATNGHHQRTSSQQFCNEFATSQCQSPTSRPVKMLGCGKFLSVGGDFAVQQVVELLWARPLVVSVAGKMLSNKFSRLRRCCTTSTTCCELFRCWCPLVVFVVVSVAGVRVVEFGPNRRISTMTAAVEWRRSPVSSMFMRRFVTTIFTTDYCFNCRLLWSEMIDAPYARKHVLYSTLHASIYHLPFTSFMFTACRMTTCKWRLMTIFMSHIFCILCGMGDGSLHY